MPDQNARWDEYEKLLAAGGPEHLLAELAKLPVEDQPAAFGFAAGAGLTRDWPGKGFDSLITLVLGCVDVVEPLADAETDPQRRAWLGNGWIATCYNLSAELCDCWPGDDRPRQPHHHEVGLACAERCAAGRARFGETEHSRSMNAWAKGVHLRSLGRLDEAREVLRWSLERAIEECEALGEPTETGSSAPYNILLGHGELALTELALGDPAAKERLTAVRTAFTAQSVRGGEAAEDAKFGLGCLAKVARNLGLQPAE